MVKLACPELSAAVLSATPPRMKVIVPVAAAGLTVAVNVTACPTYERSSEDVTVVAVAMRRWHLPRQRRSLDGGHAALLISPQPDVERTFGSWRVRKVHLDRLL